LNGYINKFFKFHSDYIDMNTNTENLEKLLKYGLFDIPEYQRSFSWEKPQLDDLIEDLQYLPKDQKHFFGNIILERKGDYHTTTNRKDDVYEVVDGQQRLTSALIFLKVACDLNSDVKEGVEEINLISFPRDRDRLVLQDEDKQFFRDDILGSSTYTPSRPSQKRLRRAKTHFKEYLDELDDDTVLSLATRLRYDFRINVVEVDDKSEAAAIFESINTRGKDLSSLEKTKSFLMYMDDRIPDGGSLRDDINNRFGKIYRNLFVLEEGHERVDDFDEDSFQRFHWGMYDGYDSDEYFNSLQTLKTRLYKKYRKGNYEDIVEKIDEYTKSIREASDSFAKLFTPSEHEDSVKNRLIRLLELGRMANVLPVLIASDLKYGDDPSKMKKIIEKCETLVFRVYAIDGRRSDTGLGKLVNLAHEIYNESVGGIDETIRKLEKIIRKYTSDNRFERELRDPEFDVVSSKDIRFLLYHYGQELEIKSGETIRKDLSQILSKDFSVEHILARNLPEEDIPDDLTDDFEDYVHRLGNLTIASRYWNSTYGNLPFEEKKKISDENGRETAYENSTLKVQRVLSYLDDFKRQEIKSREDKIVEFALSEWSLDTEPTTYKVPDSLPKTVEKIEEEMKDYDDLDFDGLDLFVLAAVRNNPGKPLRNIHKTAAKIDESPIEWTESWSEERENVRGSLWKLKGVNLVSLTKRSWYPVDRDSEE